MRSGGMPRSRSLVAPRKTVCASRNAYPDYNLQAPCTSSILHRQPDCDDVIQVEEGAALVFNSTDGELYNLWFREALPTYGGPLRYRAHLDCDRCRWLRIADSTPAPAERSQMCDS